MAKYADHAALITNAARVLVDVARRPDSRIVESETDLAWACPVREQSMVTRWGPLRAGWLSAVLRAVPAGPSGCSVDAVLHAHSEVGPALSRPRLA